MTASVALPQLTRDGARSWTLRVLPALGTLTFATAADGWLWVPPSFDGRGGGTLAVTRDGGQTWQPFSGGAAALLRARGTGGSVADLQFASATVGWAAVVARDYGTTTLLKTMDGGQTWTVIDVMALP